VWPYIAPLQTSVAETRLLSITGMALHPYGYFHASLAFAFIPALRFAFVFAFLASPL
jgi:hypothetical protein